MMERNSPRVDRKSSYYCTYYLDMLRKSRRDTKLSEFSRNSNKEELRLKKMTPLCNGLIAMDLLRWIGCNGFLLFLFFGLLPRTSNGPCMISHA